MVLHMNKRCVTHFLPTAADSLSPLGSCSAGLHACTTAWSIIIEVSALQAAGSTLLARICHFLVLDALHTAGLSELSAVQVYPLATGMALTCAFLACAATRPVPAEARFVSRVIMHCGEFTADCVRVVLLIAASNRACVLLNLTLHQSARAARCKGAHAGTLSGAGLIRRLASKPSLLLTWNLSSSSHSNNATLLSQIRLMYAAQLSAWAPPRWHVWSRRQAALRLAPVTM